MRDNLQDQGQVPSIGSAFASPDLIVHEQVADPTTFFKESYELDVNQQLNTESTINLIYVRVKNLSSESQVGYIHMYYSNTSLFLNPTKWKQQKLETTEGFDYVCTGVIEPGGIGVGLVPFVFNAKKGHFYCHVGYVSNKSGTPEIPDDFPGFGQYSEWLHNNTNICMRNFNYKSGSRYYLENSCEFSNPFPESWSGMFQIQLVKKFPVGTIIHFVCAQLGKDETISIIDSSISQYPIAVTLAPNVLGIATVKITLPAGESGTSGSGVSINFLVAPKKEEIHNCPHFPITQLGLDAEHPIFKDGPSYLVKVGACSVVFSE